VPSSAVPPPPGRSPPQAFRGARSGRASSVECNGASVAAQHSTVIRAQRDRPRTDGERIEHPADPRDPRGGNGVVTGRHDALNVARCGRSTSTQAAPWWLDPEPRSLTCRA
jgi:hypothetical protein